MLLFVNEHRLQYFGNSWNGITLSILVSSKLLENSSLIKRCAFDFLIAGESLLHIQLTSISLQFTDVIEIWCNVLYNYAEMSRFFKKFYSY